MLASVILSLGLAISGAAMLLGGLPLVFVFRKRGWLLALPVCAVAAAIGALALTVFFLFVDRSGLSPGGAVLGAGFGAFAGAAFSLTAGLSWRLRRP
jgi:hypothetical protein